MTEEIKATCPVLLDFGCGKNKINDGRVWLGVDAMAFDGVDVVLDLTAKEKSIQNEDYSITHTYKAWPWENSSVDEIHASHFMEHLDASERIHFVNEIYRVLKIGSSAKIITPHFASCRSYGDLTHKWPPVSEFFFYYLSKEWRNVNAPHNIDYMCNFSCVWGYSIHPSLQLRNQEMQNFALQNYKEAAQDIVCTMTKMAMPDIEVKVT
jgi:hypothetical protein